MATTEEELAVLREKLAPHRDRLLQKEAGAHLRYEEKIEELRRSIEQAEAERDNEIAEMRLKYRKRHHPHVDRHDELVQAIEKRKQKEWEASCCYICQTEHGAHMWPFCCGCGQRID